MLTHAQEWIEYWMLFRAFFVPVEVAKLPTATEALLIELGPLWEELLAIGALKMNRVFVALKKILSWLNTLFALLLTKLDRYSTRFLEQWSRWSLLSLS